MRLTLTRKSKDRGGLKRKLVSADLKLVMCQIKLRGIMSQAIPMLLP